MKLVIAEKPNMAEAFADAMKHTGKFTKASGYYKNSEYVITWAYGHLVNSKEPQDYPKELFKGWEWDAIPFVPPTGNLEYYSPSKTDFDTVRKRQLENIRNVYKAFKFDEIINACDAEREGHLIGQEIIDVCKMKEPVKRLWVQSKVEKDIQKAFANLKDEKFYNPRKEAAYARQFADYILGHNLTVAFSIKSNSRLHVGRVQTPTLSLLVNRRLDIDNFVPKDYFEIKANFGDKYSGQWFKESKGNTKIDTKPEAEDLLNKINGQESIVTIKDVEDQKIKPHELFDLGSLSGEANKKYGFTMQKTLDIAQLLYDKYKVTSYPRTDSKYIMNSQVAELPLLLDALNTGDYKEFVEDIILRKIPTSARFVNDKKVTDHYAIIPTSKRLNPAEVRDEIKDKKTLASREDILNLYDLIVRRFLAVFYKEAIYEKTEIVTEVAGETFKTNGRILKHPGWQVVYGKDSEENKENDNEDKVLPPIEKDEINTVTNAELLSKKTKPKPHYDDRTIGSAMENAKDYIEEDELKEEMKEAKAGLGTSATRAQIIENLISRNYIERKGKKLIATDLAVKLISIAPERLKSPEVTAEWEKELRLIEEEEVLREDFYERIINFVTEEIRELQNKNIEVKFDSNSNKTAVANCPKCGQPIIEFQKGFACTTSTPEGVCFRVWKNIAGKSISASRLKSILEKGVSPIIKGFKTKSGTNFEAKIKLKDTYDSFEFVFEEAKELDYQCPNCQGKVLDKGKFISCENNKKDSYCFSIPKELKGKKLSLKVIKDIATKGKTELIDGFVGKSKYSAYLIYKDRKLSFEFPKRQNDPTAIKCPSCGSTINEKEKTYSCSSQECKFVVWKNISGKTISLELLKNILEVGETETLDGFTSRKSGKGFKAKLIWNPDKLTVEMKF